MMLIRAKCWFNGWWLLWVGSSATSQKDH